MSKVSDVLNMLQILKDKQIHSISSLSQELEVSKRTNRQKIKSLDAMREFANWYNDIKKS